MVKKLPHTLVTCLFSSSDGTWSIMSFDQFLARKTAYQEVCTLSINAWVSA